MSWVWSWWRGGGGGGVAQQQQQQQGVYKEDTVAEVPPCVVHGPTKKTVVPPVPLDETGRVIVLAIDGGGLRGVLPATLLDRLNAQVPFLDNVQVFAGTSTGALVAAALAANFSPSSIVEMYMQMAPQVFAHTFISDVEDVDGLWASSYAQGQIAMAKQLEAVFGDMTIGQLSRKVIFPTFDLGQMADASTGRRLRHWKPHYMTNFGEGADLSLKVVDCILRSSAAPTYFPSYQNCIDGGMVANNPSMVALAQVVSGGDVALSQVVLLSLGTGVFDQCLAAGPTVNWGAAEWAPHLLDIIFDGTSEQAGHQCHCMLGPHRFRRLNPTLPSNIRLDKTSAIDQLREIGSHLNIDDDVAWLQAAFCKENKKK